MRRWFRYWFWTFVYFAELHLRYLFQARAIDREIAITNYILQGYRSGVKTKDEWQDYLILGTYFRGFSPQKLHKLPEFDYEIAMRRALKGLKQEA